MSSNRVGGPTPAEPGKGQEKTVSQQNRRVEKVEKVKKVDEVENEQTRKKFQRYMEDEPPEGPRAPSPFETNFYFVTSEEKPASASEEGSVPSPAYAPPPDVNASSPPPKEEEAPLPRSKSFWKGADTPPDQPRQGPNFRETPQSAAREGQPSKGTDQKETADQRDLPRCAHQPKCDRPERCPAVRGGIQTGSP